MDELSSLESIRKRPAMYIGGMDIRGLHHLLDELLDNSIDQFLANQATSVSVNVSGSILEFTDDGPGLPFDEPGPHSESLAEYYLTQIRLHSPTADGHTPHIHLDGLGCGLRIVTALTDTCEVSSSRNDVIWRQSFSKGLKVGPPQMIAQPGKRGTTFRLTIDRDLFSDDWCQQRVDQRLIDAAYLFPGLKVESPGLRFCASRGLADLAVKIANEKGSPNAHRVWWFNESTDDIRIQAAIAGTGSDTDWRAFANGATSIEGGTHLAALKRVVKSCGLRPASALIHIIMRNPSFAGPTRSRLDVPEIRTQLIDALMPSLKAFASSQVGTA